MIFFSEVSAAFRYTTCDLALLHEWQEDPPPEAAEPARDQVTVEITFTYVSRYFEWNIHITIFYESMPIGDVFLVILCYVHIMIIKR